MSFNKITERQLGADLKEPLNSFRSLKLGVRPYLSTTNSSYYVDGLNGDDSNDGLTSTTPFKTWARVQSLIPHFLKHSFIIRVANLEESIVVENIIATLGSGTVEGEFKIIGYGGANGDAQFHAKNIIARGFIGVSGTQASFDDLIVTGRVRVYGTTGLRFYRLTFEPPVPYTESDGFYVLSSTVLLYESQFGEENYRRCISVGQNGHVYSSSNRGTGIQYGIYVTSGSTVAKQTGTQPTGGEADEYARYGSVIR